MNPDLWLERLVLIFVLISVPALIYALQRLTKRKIYNRWLVLLIYVIVFLIYFDQLEPIFRESIK